METIKLKSMEGVFCKQGGFSDNLAVCTIDDTGSLYLVNNETLAAKRLPEQYQKTPIILYHSCGGYRDGLIMVSLMGEMRLQYHHTFYDCAGIWGWIDAEFNTVIEPQYIFAENFFEGRANVCKGSWEIDGNKQYWAEPEMWGVIDHTGKEVVPCRYDALFSIDYTTELFLVHKGGWENGCFCVYDTAASEEILDLDFYIDCGYMFNQVGLSEDDRLIFIDSLSDENDSLLYVYDLKTREYLCHGRDYYEKVVDGETRMITRKDGNEIILY